MSLRSLLLLLFSLFSLFIIINSSSNDMISNSIHNDPTIVRTRSGLVRGYLTESARIFRGIRYADKPVRFTHAEPAKSWAPDIYNATEDPPGCPQNCTLPPFTCPNITNEDCLFLNVFTPLSYNTTEKLPVMVFLHGGNFYQGFCGGPLYDGRYIVNSSSVILVAMNYRLGALGFFVGSQSTNINGNFGFTDQRLALRWVHENIGEFGGDPSRITAFGQSAGAISIIAHLTSLRSGGLFHAAILESEPFTIPLKTTREARLLGDKFVQALNCSSNEVECLRKASIDEILVAQRKAMNTIVDYDEILQIFLQWTPVIDDIELTRQPLDAIRTGQHEVVPMMLGTTAEEAISFIYQAFTEKMSVTFYELLVFAVFRFQALTVLEHYPPNSSGDQRPLTSEVATKYVFSCSNLNATGLLANERVVPVWHYVFDHAMSFDGWGPNYTFCVNHSCHGVELPFVFNSATLANYTYTPEEEILAQSLVNYWTSFARYLDPNFSGKESLEWPGFQSPNFYSMKFSTPNNAVYSNLLKSDCALFQQIGYNI